jgi:hypothetical protein
MHSLQLHKWRVQPELTFVRANRMFVNKQLLEYFKVESMKYRFA